MNGMYVLKLRKGTYYEFYFGPYGKSEESMDDWGVVAVDTSSNDVPSYRILKYVGGGDKNTYDHDVNLDPLARLAALNGYLRKHPDATRYGYACG